MLAATMGDKKTETSSPPISTIQNPFEIKPAVIFAFLFVLLSIVTVWVKQLFGGGGLLALSAIVGVTDIDPFILSIIDKNIPIEKIMSSAILVSMMSNTIVKGFYLGFLAKSIRNKVFYYFAAWALFHLVFVFI